MHAIRLVVPEQNCPDGRGRVELLNYRYRGPLPHSPQLRDQYSTPLILSIGTITPPPLPRRPNRGRSKSLVGERRHATHSLADRPRSKAGYPTHISSRAAAAGPRPPPAPPPSDDVVRPARPWLAGLVLSRTPSETGRESVRKKEEPWTGPAGYSFFPLRPCSPGSLALASQPRSVVSGHMQATG